MSILVTGIGGNVAQGALRILRDVAVPYRLIGTDMILPCGGTHLCDATYPAPHARDRGYLATIQAICAAEDVLLVLPCTDIEAVVLANVTVPALTSSLESQLAFLDKYATGRACEAAGIPFATTYLPSTYPAGLYKSVVVKEREGRGSRGVHFDPPDVAAFSDDFVVQGRLSGPEVTIGFYADRESKPHGFIVLERDLRQTGTTMLATVTREYDRDVALLVEQIATAFEVRGSCNIQAIVTGRGVIPFEINGRISGSASIRHRFGYPDVAWAVIEHLLGLSLPPPEIKSGTAVRLLLDVIYPDQDPGEIHSEAAPHGIF